MLFIQVSHVRNIAFFAREGECKSLSTSGLIPGKGEKCARGFQHFLFLLNLTVRD